ncbi:uncharacterized protein LOC135480953 [Liolophura sinensis]|uniref:uncharacterized protein LOC135480953 n=1 Tax=Liolophura sinensis TaxID=3198878 RepID=UPI00315808B4
MLFYNWLNHVGVGGDRIVVDLVHAAQRLVGSVAGCGVCGWVKGRGGGGEGGMELGRTHTNPMSRTVAASWSPGCERRRGRVLEQVLCLEAIYEQEADTMLLSKNYLVFVQAEILTFLMYFVRVSDATATCQDLECPAEQTCVMKPVMCVRAPCDPIPICEAADAKPGSCPRVHLTDLGSCVSNCQTDRECESDEKCCSNGCGKVCRAPIMASPCPGLTNGPCIEQCRSDDDCRDGYRCCYNGCGHSCIRAVNGPYEKPGICPWHLFIDRKERCGSTCDTDLDCSGLEKCCRNGCGRSCRQPCLFRRNDSRGRSVPRRDFTWTMPYFCGREWMH